MLAATLHFCVCVNVEEVYWGALLETSTRHQSNRIGQWKKLNCKTVMQSQQDLSWSHEETWSYAAPSESYRIEARCYRYSFTHGGITPELFFLNFQGSFSMFHLTLDKIHMDFQFCFFLNNQTNTTDALFLFLVQPWKQSIFKIRISNKNTYSMNRIKTIKWFKTDKTQKWYFFNLKKIFCSYYYFITKNCKALQFTE